MENNPKRVIVNLKDEISDNVVEKTYEFEGIGKLHTKAITKKDGQKAIVRSIPIFLKDNKIIFASQKPIVDFLIQNMDKLQNTYGLISFKRITTKTGIDTIVISKILLKGLKHFTKQTEIQYDSDFDSNSEYYS